MNVQLILNRMKDAYGVRENKELATRLGITNPAISQAIRNQSLHLSHIEQCVNDTGADYHYLITGEKLRDKGIDEALHTLITLDMIKHTEALDTIKRLLINAGNQQHCHDSQVARVV